jgi:hypothetical protein
LEFLTFNFSDFETFPVLARHYIICYANDFAAQTMISVRKSVRKYKDG